METRQDTFTVNNAGQPRYRFSRHILGLAAAFAGLLALAASASNVTYTYDPAGRLVAADHGAGKTISYAYDHAGKLLRSAGSVRRRPLEPSDLIR